MKGFRNLTGTIVFTFLAVTLVKGAVAQPYAETETFFAKNYPGIFVIVNATKETVPGTNLRIDLWINCTSVGVEVDYINMSIYGFREGREKIPLGSADSLHNTSMTFNNTILQSSNTYVPMDVWDATYCELHLKYTIAELPLEYDPSFPVTIVRNVPFEQFKEDFRGLFGRLMEQYKQYKQLNQTYDDLKKELTALQDAVGELDNARRVAVVMGITTVFFVATTIFLVMRKPRELW